MENRQRARRLLIIAIGIIIIIVTLVLLIVIPATNIGYLTPSPDFTINDAKLSTFNLSTATTLTSNLRITISARNRKDNTYHRYYNDKPFHFEKIDVYASYRNQQITLPTMLPPTYLGYADVMVWSLSLNGTDVPLSPDLGQYLVQDVTVGNVLVDVHVTGRLRANWRSFSRPYRLEVNCREYIMFGNDSDIIGSAFKRPLGEGCHVRVKPLKSIMQVLTSVFHK